MARKFQFGKTIYSFGMQDRINEQLPETVKTAMKMSGWNAFGVYELVLSEIRKEQARARRERKEATP